MAPNVTRTLLALSAVVAACGGGGDGPAPVDLTVNNYIDVAHEALTPIALLTQFSELTTGSDTTFAARSLNFAPAGVPKAVAKYAAVPKATDSTLSETLNCSGGGTLVRTFFDRSLPGTIDAGDSMALEARGCIEDTETINGTVTLDFTAASGDVSNLQAPYAYAVTVTLSGFSVQSGGWTQSTSGSYTVTENRQTANTGSTNFNVATLTSVFDSSSVHASITITGYRIDQTRNENGLDTSISGSVDSLALSGNRLTIATGTVFHQAAGDEHPTTGVLTISAARGGVVRCTSQNAQSVLIELDANGDGNFEASSTVPWTDFF